MRDGSLPQGANCDLHYYGKGGGAFGGVCALLTAAARLRPAPRADRLLSNGAAVGAVAHARLGALRRAAGP